MMLLILIGIIDMRKFLGLLIFISSAAYTQELDSLETDTVEILPKHLVGGFVELGISQRPGPAGNASMRNVGLGLRYDRYELEYHVNVFSGDYIERLIFPNSFKLIPSSHFVSPTEPNLPLPFQEASTCTTPSIS